MANNVLQIKRSKTTANPGQLKPGEFAHTEATQELLLGNFDGTGNLVVGGKKTVDQAQELFDGSTTPMRRAVRVDELSQFAIPEFNFDPETGELLEPETPHAPLNVSHSAAFTNISIKWESPTYIGHKKAEIWRNTTNTIVGATLIGETIVDSFVDPVDMGSTHYYWVRFVNVKGVTGPFHTGNVNGLVGQTSQDPTVILEIIAGQINESHLVQEINDKLTAVDDLNEAINAVDVGIKDRLDSIDQTVNDAENGLVAKTAELEDFILGVDGLSEQIDDLNASVYDAANGLISRTGDIESVIGDAQSGLVKDVTDLQTSLTDAEENIFVNSTAISGLDTRVSAAEGNITSQATQFTALESSVSDLGTTVSGNSTAISGLDTRVTASEGNITSQSTQITNLQNSVTNLQTGQNANNTAISGLDTRVTANEDEIESQANQITVLQSNLASGAVNLLPNANYEGSYTDHLIGGVIVDDVSEGVANVYSGSHSLKVTGIGQYSAVFRQRMNAGFVEFREGQLYTIGFWAKNTDTNSREFGYLGGGGYGLITVPGNTDWAWYTSQFTIPAGFTTNDEATDPSWDYQHRSTAAWTGSVYIDRIVLIRGNTALDGSETFTTYESAFASTSAIENLETRVTSAEGTIISQGTRVTNLESTVNNPTTGVAANATAISGLSTRVTDAEGIIDSHSSEITQLENTISNFNSGDNLLLDPDFEKKVSGVNSDAWQSLVGTTYGYEAENGGASLRITANGTIRDVYALKNIKARNGEKFYSYARVFVSSDFNGTVYLGSSSFDVNDTTLGHDNSGGFANQVTKGQWVDVYKEHTLSGGGVNTDSIRMRLSVRSDATTGYVIFGYAYFGRIPRADNTATSSAFQGLDSRVTSAEGTITAQADEITSLQSGLSNTALLVEDPTFANGLDSWVQTATASENDGQNYITAPGLLLENEYTITPDGFSTSKGGIWIYSRRAYKVDTSRTYRMRFKIRSVVDNPEVLGNRIYCGVQTLDGNFNNQTGGSGTHRYLVLSASVITAGAGWREFEATITGEGDTHNQFRSGTVYVRPMFILNHNPGASSGTVEVAHCYFEDATAEVANATAISGLSTRVTDDGKLLTVNSSEYTSLAATVNNPTTGVDANAAALGAISSRITDSGKIITANSSEFTSLNNTVTISTATPLNPSIQSLTQDVNFGTVTIVVNTQADDKATRYEIWNSFGDETDYSLIAEVPKNEITGNSFTIVDETITRKTRVYYKVYAVNRDIYSPGTSSNIDLTTNLNDVSDLKVIAGRLDYFITYNLPDSSILSHVEIRVEARTTNDGLFNEVNGTLIYSGENSSYTYEVPLADQDKYHKFWVKTVARI